MNRINRFLDVLPGVRLGHGGRASAVLRTLSLAGFYGALIMMLGGGLLADRSLLILTTLALVVGLSLIIHSHVYKRIVGRDMLVSLEYEWFALSCSALTLWVLDEPILPYMDIVAVGMCPLLAAGRVGCTFVGCCYGRACSYGITYQDRSTMDGFPQALVGIRLFPTPAIEALGLVLIGLVGLVSLPLALPGQTLAWCLIASSVMRFGLDGTRLDPQPRLLRLSQAQWMSLVEFSIALQLAPGEEASTSTVNTLVYGSLVIILLVRQALDPRLRLLRKQHVNELRELVQAAADAWDGRSGPQPVLQTTSQGISVAVSSAQSSPSTIVHVSLSRPGKTTDLVLLCELAARAFPQQVDSSASFTAGSILHLQWPGAFIAFDTDSLSAHDNFLTLYGKVMRHLQRECERDAAGSASLASSPSCPGDHRAWWFRCERSGAEERR
jgi:prolipoprotein diacylglyceryltransferase